MEFMLDTDTASFIIKNHPQVVAMAEKHNGEWCISSIVYQELFAGLLALKSAKHEESFSNFLRLAEVVSFTMADAMAAAEIRRDLKQSGLNIGHMDEQIAGHAANSGLTLVSGNQKHFSTIKGLSLASWV